MYKYTRIKKKKNPVNTIYIIYNVLYAYILYAIYDVHYAYITIYFIGP